jgi:uncharacterized membrane protein
MGIAFAKICDQMRWFEALAKPQLDQAPARALKFIGRHSLVYYLLHQPIMIAILLAGLWLAGSL